MKSISDDARGARIATVSPAEGREGPAGAEPTRRYRLRPAKACQGLPTRPARTGQSLPGLKKAWSDRNPENHENTENRKRRKLEKPEPAQTVKQEQNAEIAIFYHEREVSGRSKRGVRSRYEPVRSQYGPT